MGETKWGRELSYGLEDISPLKITSGAAGPSPSQFYVFAPPRDARAALPRAWLGSCTPCARIDLATSTPNYSHALPYLSFRKFYLAIAHVPPRILPRDEATSLSTSVHTQNPTYLCAIFFLTTPFGFCRMINRTVKAISSLSTSFSSIFTPRSLVVPSPTYYCQHMTFCLVWLLLLMDDSLTCNPRWLHFSRLTHKQPIDCRRSFIP